MRVVHARGWVAILFCLCVLVIPGIGCGPGDGRATVGGTVSFDGVPVDSGVITLLPVPGSGGIAAGGVIENGTYSITRKGPLPGKYKVQITGSRSTGEMVEAPTIGGPGAKPGTMVEQMEQYIPEKYNENTELEIEIERGRNRRDFTLSSAG